MADRNGNKKEKLPPSTNMTIAFAILIPVGAVCIIIALIFLLSDLTSTIHPIQWALFGILFTIGFSLIVSVCLFNFGRKKRLLAEISAFREVMRKWEANTYSALYKYVPPGARWVSLNGRSPCYAWLMNGSMFLLPYFDFAETERFFDFNKLAKSESALNSIFFITEIPLQNIEFYCHDGEKMIENRVSSGGGAGVLIGIGGLGMVVGGSSPQSRIIVHDERKTVLSYFNNGIRTVMNFHNVDFHVFEEFMPEKNYDIVLEIKKNKIINNDIPAQIMNLAKLRDEGILTEEEFTQKKTELLQKIK